jgi:Cu+-exporting ATPase
MIRIDVIVNGMMCQNNCAATVRAALFQLDGAVEADAVYAQKRAYAVFSNAFAQRDECYRRVVQAIENVGYEVVRELETNGNHDSGSQAATVGAAINSLPTQISQHQQHDTLDNDDSTTTSLLDTTTSTFELQIGGMSCAVCAGRVEQALRAVEHVRSATVVLATNRARVVVNTSTINSSSNNNNNNTQKKNKILQQRCVRAVCNAGYECQIAPEVGASLVDHARQWTTAQQAEVQGWRTLLVWSVAGTVPLLLLQGHNIPSFVVASVVQLGVGARFYKAAYKGLVLSHSLGMDALVVLGTSASYVYSAVAMTTAGDDAPTFATAAMILTFVTFGKNLEAYAKNKTARSLQALMELQPNEACRIRVSPDTDNDNITEDRIAGLTTENVPLEHVRVGDLLRVLPNTRIPTDSILVACSGPNSQNQHAIAYADESALSGEPFPVVKRVGDALFGSTMNQSSVLVVRVTATGSETVLANIVQLVRDAQGNKAAIHVLADRLAHVFAPTVMLLSFLTLVGWLWFTGNMYDACMSAISVMVVACPCSLGLATPTAVMVRRMFVLWSHAAAFILLLHELNDCRSLIRLVRAWGLRLAC